ncbi:MAG: ATP-binding protein [Armatimonadota bacterium]
MNSIHVVISRDNTGDHMHHSFEDALADKCLVSGHYDVLLIPHIYHLSEASLVWVSLPVGSTELVFLSWMHPRPSTALLHQHRCGIDESHVFNMAAYQSEDDCYAAIEALWAHNIPDATSKGSLSEITDEITDRWYPVMDGSRCTNCGNCLQFCIFNVYEYDAEHHVTAANPENCKPGCPACSRVCPKSAISFPLYTKDEAIAGAPGLFVTMSSNPRKPQASTGGSVCSLCGQKPTLMLMTKSDPAAELCKQCGRTIPATQKPAPQPPQGALDDLDSLVDDLEKLAQKRL